MRNLFNKARQTREQKKLAQEKLGNELCLLEDEVFKTILTENDEDSREALRSLITACTGREVAAFQVLNNELNPVYYHSKKPRVDVLVTFNDGEVVDLEMQTDKSDDDIRMRAEYYKSMLVASQLKRGKQYESIKRVYQVFFLNCIMFPDSDKLPRRYYYQEETEHDKLSDLSEIILYELPKLKKLNDYNNGKIDINTLTFEEIWCIYMKYRHEKEAKELIAKLCQKEKGIMHAEKAVRKLSRDEKKFYQWYLKTKAEMEDEAYERMLRKEGDKARQISVAQKMKNAGEPVSKIIEFTGLSQEEIEKL